MTHGRVLLAGTWEEGPGYPRTSALRECLKRRGVECVELKTDLPFAGVNRRRLVRSPWRWPGFAFRLFRARRRFVAQLRETVRRIEPDAVLVPYPGHLSVRWVRVAYRGPIVLDLFLSAYSTVVLDRELYRPGSIAARMFLWLDRRACRAAQLVLMDTPSQAEYVEKLVETGVMSTPPSRPGQPSFDWLPVGFAEEPRVATAPRDMAQGEPLELLFFGTGVPLHGLDLLIEAVAACSDVRLVLVGGSVSDRERAERCLGSRLELCPEFVGPVELRQKIEHAHLVAGIFGRSEKAGMVIPFKVVHALAAGRPVITMNSPAVRELLEPGVDCLVTERNPEVLAARLSALSHQPELLAEIGRNGRRKFEQTFSLAAAGKRLCGQLSRLTGRPIGTEQPEIKELQESEC